MNSSGIDGYKTQTGDPSIVSTLHYFLHNGELTLHYFLTVDCGLVQWPVGQEQKATWYLPVILSTMHSVLKCFHNFFHII